MINGGHLSRWSQLAGNADRNEILRSSVLSNLDEMCEWGEENNVAIEPYEGQRCVKGTAATSRRVPMLGR